MIALLLNNLLLIRKLANHIRLQIRNLAMHIRLQLEDHRLHHFHQHFPQIRALHPLQNRLAPRLNRRLNLLFSPLRLFHQHLRRRGRNRRSRQRSRRVSLLLRRRGRRRLSRRAAQQSIEAQRRDRLRREHGRDGSREIQGAPEEKSLVCGGRDHTIVENVGGHDGAGRLENPDDSIGEREERGGLVGFQVEENKRRVGVAHNAVELRGKGEGEIERRRGLGGIDECVLNGKEWGKKYAFDEGKHAVDAARRGGEEESAVFVYNA